MNPHFTQYNMSFVSFPCSLHVFLSTLLDNIHDSGNLLMPRASLSDSLSSSDRRYDIAIHDYFASPWISGTPTTAYTVPTHDRDALSSLPFGNNLLSVSAAMTCIVLLLVGFKVLPQLYARNTMLSRQAPPQDWMSTAGRLEQGPEIEHCACCASRSPTVTVFYRLECLRCHAIDKVPIFSNTEKLDNTSDDESLTGETLWEQETNDTFGDDAFLWNREYLPDDMEQDSNDASSVLERLETTELDYVFRDLCYHASKE